MSKLKQRVAQWMQGRYGIDALYRGLFGAYLGSIVLSMLTARFEFFYLGTAIAMLGFYRVFSKQLSKRAAENQRYLLISGKIKRKALLWYNRIKYWRTHRYRSCPHCKSTLRLEKKIGVLTVTCPRCHNTFDLTINH